VTAKPAPGVGIERAPVTVPRNPSVGTALLLREFTDLTVRLALSKDQLAGFLQISPATVRAWKRDRTGYYWESPQVSTLFRLCAAVAMAREEFSEQETSRLIRSSPHRPGAPRADAAALSTLLIRATQVASVAAFTLDDGYDSATAPPTPIAELEAGERELSAALTRHHRRARGPHRTFRSG